MLKNIVFFLILLASSSIASPLEDQIKQLEYSKKEIESQKRQAINEIDRIIYDSYIKHFSFTIDQPVIQSINGNLARVQIAVSFKVSDKAITVIHHTLNKYLKVNESDNRLSYEFDALCYNKKECHTPLMLKTPVSPAVWNRLTQRALRVEIDFMGKNQFGLLIGQTLGNYGEILKNGSFKFTLDIPKSKIKGNPMPKIRIGKYKCKWNYKLPKYQKISA